MHLSSFPAALLSRVSGAAVAYIVSAAALATTLLLLTQVLSPNALQQALMFVFITGIAFAIEPGTARAHLIRTQASAGPGGVHFPLMWLVSASAIKAIVLSLPLSAIWLFTAGTTTSTLFVICLTIVTTINGFLVTDLRVVLDAHRRHAAAIWLKQGCLSLGVVSLGAALWRGLPFEAAAGLCALVRVIWTVWLTHRGNPYFDRQASLIEPARIRDFLWLDFAGASVVAALGGSLDRIIAGRMLSVPEANAYYLIYEIVTKFWLLPYILAPIVFAQRATGGPGSQALRKASLPLIPLSAALVGIAYFTTLMFHESISTFAGIAVAPLHTAIFAAAIALASFNMLLAADLQGGGQARAVVVALSIGVPLSGLVFYLMVHAAGLQGMFWSWIIKVLLDSLILLLCYRSRFPR